MIPAAPARAARIYTYDAGAPSATASPPPPRETSTREPSRGAPHAVRAPRAPSEAPLLAGATLTNADASSSAASSGGDPLVENGLGSPLCAAGASELSTVSRRNCATSGFEAAGAPSGNYGLDVHIDTGALGFTAATLEQDYLIGPVWMGLVWVVHTLVVALEWCFTLDLLDSSAMGGVERALRATQATFTRPWLVLALALASLAAAYNGLVRRRVAETLGQAALMLAMMACGLWVIADPTGTVGALGRWADAASIGTLGAVVQGTPARAQRTLAGSMGTLFEGVVGAPWCYLEFGDVRWCEEPSLLDRRLRAAALRIAAAAQSTDACDAGSLEGACQTLAGEQPRERLQSAALLGAARTNGELFLALPADAAARNSINDGASLLRVLCGDSTDATDCRGPTAAEAEFRTQGGTAPRVGGLLLIALGALGMLLLFGFIALHLLGAALVALLYLLLAPAAVIAPALGDGGRAVFRAWATRLLGAIVSKLLFSFLLGVVLLLTRMLLELHGIGWWTRWLLVSAMWWGSYCQRRRVLGFARGELLASGAGHPRQGHTGARAGDQASIARRVQRQFESPRAALQAARWVRGRFSKPAPNVDRKRLRERVGRERAQAIASQQATQMLERERTQAREDVADAPRAQTRLAEKRAQLQRVRGARASADAAGDGRRSARLGFRARRIEGEIDAGQRRLNVARELVAKGQIARRASGHSYTRAEVEERGRFLDAQAALPASRSRRGGAAAPDSVGEASGGQRRDYAALASLAGYAREQYSHLDPRHQREARLAIDRKLAVRRELGAVVGEFVTAEDQGTQADVALEHQDRLRVGREFDRALERRLHDGRPDAGPAWERSAVMRDAREVALGRKRQLGA